MNLWVITIVCAAQFVSSPPRDLLRSLTHLNQIVTARYFNYTVLAPIYDTQANLFKDAFEDREEEFAEGRTLAQFEHDILTKQVAAFHDTVKDKLETKFNPPSGESLDFGVAATKYEDDNLRVIVFRGTAAEFHDMMLSLEPWFLDKLQSQVKSAWQTHVGSLPAESAEREAQNDMADRVAVLAGRWSLLSGNTDWKKLDWKVEWESLLKNGYWPLIKELVRQWMPADRNLASEKQTIFTGHGYAGFYAQLVSMWLEKSDGKQYDTYAFGSPGVQCSVKYTLNTDFSADMDLSSAHPQIKVYNHALDPYGQFDYGGGKVCTITGDLPSATKYFCGQIVGLSGAKFVSTGEEWRSFQRCLYYTHSIDAVAHWLSSDSVLAADGTTDGGCVASNLIPDWNSCPPCSSERCSKRLIKPPLNWNFPPGNPCTSGEEAVLTMKEFSHEDFDQCLILGRDAYAVMGSSVDSSSGMTLLSVGMHYSLNPVLPALSSKFALGLQEHTGGVRAVLQSSDVNMDVVVNLNEKGCTGSNFGLEFCVGLSEVAQNTTSRRLQEISDLFLTMGFGSDAIATKVGTMSAGILNEAGEGFSIPTRAVQKQIVQLKQAAKMEATLPTYSGHPCRADNEEVALFETIEEEDLSCTVLGQDSAILITEMTTDAPPPVVEDKCYSRLREIIMESFEETTPDATILDGMLDILFLNCARITDPTVCGNQMNAKDTPEALCVWANGKCSTSIKAPLIEAGLYTTDFVSYFNEIEACAKENAPLTEFLCEAVNNADLWPRVGTERKASVKRAVHYALLIEKIIQITQDNTSTDFLHNMLYASLNPLLDDPDVPLTQVANTFEMAKLYTISHNVMSWAAPNDCCQFNPGATAFKVNVMEAVMEDIRLGYPSNAQAGLAMTLAPTKRVSTTKEHKDLYTAWNMAFVSHYPNNPYFYAKLLTPSVLCSEPKYYIYNRVIGLYVHLWSTLLSRVLRLNDPDAPGIVEDIDWINPAMTKRWGVINNVHADYWLQRETLPSYDGEGKVVRMDLMYTAFGRTVNSIVVATIKNDFDDLRLQASRDGGEETSVALSENKKSCMDLVGGLNLCFDLSTSARRLAEESFDTPTHIVKASIEGFNFESSSVKIFDVPKPHPCLSHAFGLEDEDEIFMKNKDCTVLGPNSYLHTSNVCNDGECELNMKFFLGLLGRRRLQQSFAPSDQLIQMKVTTVGERVRGVIKANDETVYDVALAKDTSQCLGSALMKTCILRRDDTLSLTLNLLGFEREMNLASIVNSKLTFDQPATWGLLATAVSGDPAPFDPCDDITCPENFVCATGTPGQDPCFPSLYETDGNTKLLEQMLHIASSPYANFAMDVYEEEGWTLNKRECLNHESDVVLLGWDTREDCLLVYQKVTAEKTVCAIAFEGSDDPNEALESALMMGRVLHNGYWVWRGMMYEYERYKKLGIWDDMLKMTQDPAQCNQVYIAGHSFGASLSVLFRMEFSYGRVVSFATNNMFPPGFAPKTAMGDSFRKQLDPVQALPPGWVSGGLREHVLCDDGNIWSRGINPSRRFGGKDFCDMSEHAVVSYEAWMVEFLKKSDAAKFGICPEVDWMSRCIETACGSGESGICAFGEEVLKAKLVWKERNADVLEKLTLTPNAMIYDLIPKGLCPETLEENHGCLNFGEGAFLDVVSEMQADANVLKAKLQFSILSDLLECRLVGTEDSVQMHITVAEQTLPLAYELPKSSHACPEITSSRLGKLCVMYDSLEISVVAFVDEMAYIIQIATVSVVNGEVFLTAAIKQSFIFATPETMFQSLTLGQIVYPTDGFCNKITSTCLSGNICETWRNAECTAIGVCVCAPGFCSDGQGVCVAKSNNNALAVAQQPCVGPDDAFTPLVFLPDPSNGDPYERCVILSEVSYIRFDFPTPDEAVQAAFGEPLIFRAKLFLGLPVIPLTFERIFRSEVRLTFLPVFSAKVTLIDETAGLVLAEETLALSSDTVQTICSNFASNTISTISIAEVCLLATRNTVRRLSGPRRLQETKSCSTLDSSVCAEDEVCRKPESMEECTDTAPSCVCVIEDIQETEFEATVNLPAMDRTKRSIPLAMARSDGTVETRTPKKNDTIDSLEPEPVPTNLFNPSLVVLLCCLGLCVVSILAGLSFVGGDEDECVDETGKRRSGKLSAVQFARDAHDASLTTMVQTRFDCFNSRIRQLASKLTIDNPTLRKVFCNGLPSHIIRISWLDHNVNTIQFFADEKWHMSKSAYSMAICRFLCWRRSIMMIFVCLAVLMIAMRFGEEMPRIIRAHFDGDQKMSNDELRRTVQLMSAFGRRLQETEVVVTDTQSDLERARVLIERLQVYQTILYVIKLFVSIISLYCVIRALRNWTEYRDSSSWTLWSLVLRVLVAVVITWLPWYFIFFDNQDFPVYMTQSAKIYMAFLVNLPLFSLSFMVTPALVNGSMIVIHLMPYTILPYMVIFVGPVLSMISLWPMLSAVGHGSVNYLVLYGACIYVGYACVTAMAALRALRSMEALRSLGKRTFTNSKRDSLEDNWVQSPVGSTTPMNSVMASRADIPVDPCLSPCDARVLHDTDNLKDEGAHPVTAINYHEHEDDDRRRSSTMIEFEKFANEKVLNRNMELKVFRSSRERQSRVSSVNMNRTQTRASVEIAELLVQGSLISDLQEKMQPRMRQGFFCARMMYYVGAALLVLAVVQESQDVFEVMIKGGTLWGTVITSVIDCFINNLLMQMVTVDFLLNCMIKLRLFNGYMNDDSVLTDIVGLQGFATLLTEEFRKGVKEEEQAEERRRLEIEKTKQLLLKKQMINEMKKEEFCGSSPMSPNYKRRSRRSFSLPAGAKKQGSHNPNPVTDEEITQRPARTSTQGSRRRHSQRNLNGMSQRSVSQSDRSIKNGAVMK